MHMHTFLYTSNKHTWKLKLNTWKYNFTKRNGIPSYKSNRSHKGIVCYKFKNADEMNHSKTT